MLHVIFLILKIIGIVLSILLGIIVFVLIVTLFVPIKYRMLGKKDEDNLSVDAKVTWLFHLAYLRIKVLNTKVSIKLRIAGIIIYDNLRPKNRKDNKNYNKKKGSNHHFEDEVTDNSEYKSSKIEINDKEIESPLLIESKENQLSKNLSNEIVIKEYQSDLIENENLRKVKNDNVDEKKLIEDNSDKDINSKESMNGNKYHLQEKIDKNPKDNYKNNKNDQFDKKNQNNKDRLLKLNGFFRKIKEIPSKVKSFVLRFVNIFKDLKNKIKSLVQKLKNLWIKKNLVTKFLRLEENKFGLKKVWSSLKGILKHIAPKKIKGRIVFGTGDPCSTGQALGVAAIFYGVYGDKVVVEPNFEEEVLIGDIYVKGRIRIFTLLIISIKLIRDKYFKLLLKNAKQLKEEL